MLALLDHHLLDLAGTYGDLSAGDPIQYDELRIEHDWGDVEIVVYNRAILLFTTDNRVGAADSPGVLPARRHRGAKLPHGTDRVGEALQVGSGSQGPSDRWATVNKSSPIPVS